MSLLDKIFELPPIEKRKFLLPYSKFLLDRKMDKEHNDTYIYYLTLEWSIIIGFMLSALNFVSYAYQIKFDFFLFSIDLSIEYFVRGFILYCTIYYSLILLFPVNLFFYQKMKRNVDIEAFDSLWWNDRLRGDSYKRIIRKLRLAFYVFVVGMLSSGCVGKVIADRGHLYGSYGFFLFLLLLYPYLLGTVNAGILVARVTIKNSKSRLRAQEVGQPPI